MHLTIFCTLFSMVLLTAEARGISLGSLVIGKHSIQSVAYSTYLRAVECDSEATAVEMVPHVGGCERWKIQQHGQHIAFTTVDDNGKYLRLSADGVDLSSWDRFVLWEPIRHADGTWSLKSQHGWYLSAQSNGDLWAMDKLYDDEEKFRIDEADD